MSNDSVYDKVTGQIIRALENGVIPWRREWTGTLPMNYDSGKQYQGINILTLMIAQMDNGYKSDFWLTYNQAQKHGGHIKRGEKASYIYFADKKIVEKKKQDGTVEKKMIFFAKCYPVFNLDQTEGVPCKTISKISGDRNLLEEAEKLIAPMANKPKYQEAGIKAFYRPKEDLVNLPPMEKFHSIEGYLATKFHEYAHATGHWSKQNRRN